MSKIFPLIQLLLILFLALSKESEAQKDSLKILDQKSIDRRFSDFSRINCAHGHECCSAGCSCCEELHVPVTYDTIAKVTTNGIERVTVINSHPLIMMGGGTITYVFRNGNKEVLSVWTSMINSSGNFFYGRYLRGFSVTSGFDSLLVNEFKRGYALVRSELDGMVLVDESGKKIPMKFHSSVPFGNSLRKVSVVRGNLRIYGIADVSGNLKSGLKYSQIGELSNGYAVVSLGPSGFYGLIDSTGKEVLDCNYYQLERERDGNYRAYRNGNWGLLDYSGKPISPFGFSWINSGEGIQIRHKQESGYKFVMGDSSVIDFSELYIDGTFRNGRVKVRDRVTRKTGYMNAKGKLVIPCQYLTGYEFEEGHVCVQDAETQKWGIIDVNGKVVVPFRYDRLGGIVGGLVLATMNKRGEGIINLKGEEIIPPDYWISTYFRSGSAYFQNGFCLVHTNFQYNGYCMLYGTKGKITKLDYEDVRYIFESKTGRTMPLMKGKKEGRWYLLDQNGNPLSKSGFEEIFEYSDGLINFRSEQAKNGYLNSKGEVVISPAFESAESFLEGLARVGNRNEKGNLDFYFINKEGNRINEEILPY